MSDIRLQVRAFRQQGLTYREIQQRLGQAIPKSTLSNWCADIALTAKQQQRITMRSRRNLVTARAKAAQSLATRQKEQATNIRQQAEQVVNQLNYRDAHLALAMLYLGEGYKYPSYSGLRLGSSDPLIIKLYIRLLGICYNKTPSDLKCIISHRVDQNLDTLIQYWSTLTDIPPANFYQSKPDPRTAHKPTKNRTYMGVATVSCSGTNEQRTLAEIATAILSANYQPA